MSKMKRALENTRTTGHKKSTFLKEIRELKQLSQEQMASFMGMTQGTLSRMERGQLPISMAVLRGLRRMDIDVNKMLDKDWI